MQYPNPYYVSFVIPTGATSGARIVLNGITGEIEIYNSANQLVDRIGGAQGFIRNIDPSTGLEVSLGNGELNFPVSRAKITQNTGNNGLDLESGIPFPAGTNRRSILELIQGTTTGVTGTTNAATAKFVPESGALAEDVYVAGSVVFCDTSGVITTWQTPGYTVNFAAGSTASVNYQNLQYRFDNQNNVFIEGAFHALNALAAGAYGIFTLPAGPPTYRPAKIHAVPGLHVSAADAFKATIRVNVDPTGAVALVTTVAIAVNDNFYFQIFAPLGIIP